MLLFHYLKRNTMGRKSTLLSLAFMLLSSTFSFAQINVNCLDVSIELLGGGDAIEVCEGGIADPVQFVVSHQPLQRGILMIDESGEIVFVDDIGRTIDFSTFPAGNYSVYGYSFMGALVAAPGDILSETEIGSVCYSLSDNFVTISIVSPEAGEVSLANGDREAIVCVGDGNEDVLNFANTGSGSAYAYLVTDESGIVEAVVDASSADFDAFAEGSYRVYGLSYVGDLLAQEGDDIATATLGELCFDVTEGFVAIEATTPDGGSVSLEDGSDMIEVCSAEDNPDILTFVHQTSSSAPYVYILTDANYVILSVLPANTLAFEDIDYGTSFLWGVSYTGDLLATIGGSITDALSTDCFSVSDEAVRVEKQNLQAGMVTLEGGALDATVCVGDGNTDVLNFTNDATGTEPYAYLITDENDNLLGIAGDSSHDFEGADVGVCHVWGVIYTGDITITEGQNVITDLVSNQCYGLSDNFITVNRIQAVGGTLAFADGSTTMELCTYIDGDNMIPMPEVTGNAGTGFAYVLTDADGVISMITESDIVAQNSISYVQYIYGVSYTGDILLGLEGENINDAVFTNECYEISENSVEVNVKFTDGGSVILADGTQAALVCTGDTENGILSFSNSSSSNENYGYVLTDENDVVVSFVDGMDVNFGVAQEGIYHVWGLSYTGSNTVMINQDLLTADLADGCFDLSSDFIVVQVSDVEGGIIGTSVGSTVFNFCPGNDSQDAIQLAHQGGLGVGYYYVVTDLNGNIQDVITGEEVSFNDFPEGDYLIYGVAFTGGFVGESGNNIFTDVLSTGCVDLSANSVSVSVETPVGGTITTGDGLTETSICIGDGHADILNFEVSGIAGSEYAFIVTDTSGFIIGQIPGPDFDFDNGTVGPCHVYGMAYTGNISLALGAHINEFPLSNDCYSLTDNFVFLDKILVDGGLLLTEVTSDTIYVCMDNTPDSLYFENTSAATDANYQYVLTLNNNSIINILDGNMYDFNESFFDELVLWGVSYTGDLLLEPGQIITDVDAADGCFTLSENNKTFIMGSPEGGNISTADGLTDLRVCPGADDGTVALQNTSTSHVGYAYMVMDNTGIVMDIIYGGVADFNALDPGNYTIWGFSYTGELLLSAGMPGIGPDISSSCYELSMNNITVTLDETLDGGTLSLSDGSNIMYACPGDGVPDLAILNTTSMDDGYFYVIADENDSVLIPTGVNTVNDFDPADEGVYRIYGVTLTGMNQIIFGTNMVEDVLSTACYVRSENYITIVNQTPAAGTIVSDMGDVVEVMTGDGVEDVIGFELMSANQQQIAFIITDENNKVLGIEYGDSHDFEGAEAGVCHVYGISYTGEIILEEGDDLATTTASDGCYDLTENYIRIIRIDASGLTIGEGSNQNGDAEAVSYLRMEDDIRIYPNPASNMLLMQFESQTAVTYENATLVVSDFNGQEIMRFDHQTISTDVPIDIEIDALQPGIYALSLITPNGIQSATFVKQ